jgi:hypothetical protein
MFAIQDNAWHKWRAAKAQEGAKGASVEINPDSLKPQDITRPSSCHCYGFVKAGVRCIRPGVF